MPLVGVVDPSHKEMARDTMGRLPNWLPLDEALEASADPKWAPWTQVLLRGMFAEHQERDYISTSMLVSHCPRGVVLQRKMDYVDDLASMYIPFRGTMVHRTMEMYQGPEDIAETRFYMDIDGTEVSCSPDLVDRRGLWDYKVTDNPPAYSNPWSGHTEQVQVNAYIVRHATEYQLPGGKRSKDFTKLPFDPRKTPPERCGLVYMSPKTPKVLINETQKSEDIFDPATGKFRKGKQPVVWDDKRVEKLITPRLDAIRRGLNSPFEERFGEEPLRLLFPLGNEKVWGGEDTWKCPGAPLCLLPNCLAKRYPYRLIWERETDDEA